MNNTLEGINSRITEAEEWIKDLEDRMVEITATEQRMKRNEDRIPSRKRIHSDSEDDSGSQKKNGEKD